MIFVFTNTLKTSFVLRVRSIQWALEKRLLSTMMVWKLVLILQFLVFTNSISQDSTLDQSSQFDLTAQNSIEPSLETSPPRNSHENCLRSSSNLDAFQKQSQSCPSTNQGIRKKITNLVPSKLRNAAKDVWHELTGPRLSCPTPINENAEFFVTCTGPEVRSPNVWLYAVVNCESGTFFKSQQTNWLITSQVA